MTEPNEKNLPENPAPTQESAPESAPETKAAEAPSAPPVDTPEQHGLKRPQPLMTVKPPSAETVWAEMVIAFNYLTRLNFKLHEKPKPRMIRKAMGWFPLIGALIGIFGASIDWVLSILGLPSIITAAIAVVGMLWLTRALHEEEMASLINDYSKTLESEQRTSWLTEERSVRYGTLAVIFMIIIKLGAIASLSNNDVVFQALIAACAWSRALMVMAAAWLRPVAGDPVADYFQQPPALRVVMALLIGAFVTLGVLDSYTGIVLGTGLAAGVLVALVGAHHMRGYNGQLLGTLQQVVEITVLATILVIQ